jgi:hypothetical protein
MSESLNYFDLLAWFCAASVLPTYSVRTDLHCQLPLERTAFRATTTFLFAYIALALDASGPRAAAILFLIILAMQAPGAVISYGLVKTKTMECRGVGVVIMLCSTLSPMYILLAH